MTERDELLERNEPELLSIEDLKRIEMNVMSIGCTDMNARRLLDHGTAALAALEETSAALSRCREASRRHPEMPFYIDAPGIECWVALVPDCSHEGEPVEGLTTLTFDYQNAIQLREYDERVLLHEVLHVLSRTSRISSFGEGGEERLVRHFTGGLWKMGWRWRVTNRNPSTLERETESLRERLSKLEATADGLRSALDFAYRFVRAAFVENEDAHVKGEWTAEVLERAETALSAPGGEGER